MKRAEKQAEKPIRKSKYTTGKGILPFMERPSEVSVNKGRDNVSLAAADLFSLFTADIIREQKLFTR
ncbi:MAG: hypothetical protein ACXWWD_07135 [Chitinophagaceae bacterium]